MTPTIGRTIPDRDRRDSRRTAQERCESAGMKPKRFLEAGDVVTLGADGLGEQAHEVVAYKRGM